MELVAAAESEYSMLEMARMNRKVAVATMAMMTRRLSMTHPFQIW